MDYFASPCFLIKSILGAGLRNTGLDTQIYLCENCRNLFGSIMGGQAWVLFFDYTVPLPDLTWTHMDKSNNLSSKTKEPIIVQ